MTRPLNIFGVVLGALVRAAHDVDVVVAFAAAANAFELRDGAGAAGGGFLVAAECQSLDFGEKYGV